jgi:hypothetical protein
MGSLRRKTHTDETVLSDPESFQADMCSALTNSLGGLFMKTDRRPALDGRRTARGHSG